MTLTEEQIVAMAVAAIAEEEALDVKTLRVVRFCEVGETPLARYIRETGVSYRKYQLGD